MKSEHPKKILIIGGGPAGMEAARVTSLMGHKVTLWEKNKFLGGNLNVASIAPHKEETKCLIEYLKNQMKVLNVDVVLGKEGTLKNILEINDDYVIIATGSKPYIPNIPGVNNENVVTALDVLKGVTKVGKKVVVVGGGMVGCEVAEFLVSKGKEVVIVEEFDKIARNIGPTTRWTIVKRIKRWGIKIWLSSKVENVNNDSIIIKKDDENETIKADTIVLAVGMEPNNVLYNELNGKITNLHAIGDCKKVERILEAIHAGYSISKKIS